MQTFFMQIKCALGRTYEVANALAESETASEIYSTAGDFDILAKFYVDYRSDNLNDFSVFHIFFNL